MYFTIVHVDNRFEIHVSRSREEVAMLRAAESSVYDQEPRAAFYLADKLAEMAATYGAEYVWIRPEIIKARADDTEGIAAYQFKGESDERKG